MKIYFKNESHSPILLSQNQVLGKGAEGIVYNLKGSQKVVKIYHPPERNRQRAFKLNYLIENKPPLEYQDSIIFPENVVYGEQGEFVGFVMPKVEDTIDLTLLCNLRPSAKLKLDWQEKFDRNTQAGILNRLRLCHNIAIALHKVYSTQKYVIVDIKPENIRVRLDGKIFIIDMDSVEVIKDNQLLFYAEKLTPEYSPAEIKSLDAKKDIIPLTWDYFSMAVVFYKILLGLHPFVGTCHKPYEEFTSIPQKISRGLFPLGNNRTYFEVIPEPHQNFYALPKSIQSLFIQCFDKGFRNPNQRPSTKTWIEEIRKVKKNEIGSFKQRKITKEVVKTKITRKKKTTYRSKQNSLLIQDVIAILILCVIISVGILLDKQQKNTREKTTGIANSLIAKDKRMQLYQEYKQKCKFIAGEKSYLGYRLAVDDKQRYGMVNINYKEVLITCRFDSLEMLCGSIAKFKEDGHYGFVNRFNQIIIPAKYDKAFNFFNNKKTIVQEHSHNYTKNTSNYQVISNTGEVLQSNVDLSMYDEILEFSSGYLKVKKVGKYGLLNYNLEETLPCVYTDIQKFEGTSTHALVNYKNLWGVLTTTADTMVSVKYTSEEDLKRIHKSYE